MNQLIQEAVDDVLPDVRALAQGDYAISIGGSIGRGTADERSDVDLRLFCTEPAPEPTYGEVMERLTEKFERRRLRGVEIDGCWVRRTGDIETQLQAWVSGNSQPKRILWTIWGYYLPTDIFNQHVIEDTKGIIKHWRDMLSPYPPALKASIFENHGRSLRYWMSDYHYQNKVHRADAVFLASLAARLVHDMLQILYAASEFFYPGDGRNLDLLPDTPTVPTDFKARVRDALYPGTGPKRFHEQWRALTELGAEVLAVIET